MADSPPPTVTPAMTAMITMPAPHDWSTIGVPVRGDGEIILEWGLVESLEGLFRYGACRETQTPLPSSRPISKPGLPCSPVLVNSLKNGPPSNMSGPSAEVYSYVSSSPRLQYRVFLQILAWLLARPCRISS